MIKKEQEELFVNKNSGDFGIFIWVSTAGLSISVILAVFSLYYAFGDWFGARSILIPVIPSIVAFIFSFSAMIQGILKNKALTEAEEREMLEIRKERTSAFDSDDETLFAAYRSLKNYMKFAPYAVAVFTAVIIFCLAFYCAYYYKQGEILLSANPFQAAFISFILAVPALFFGVFAIGQSRNKNFRWLRPSGVWFFMAAVSFMAASFSVLMKKYELPLWDYYLNKFFVVFFALLACELLVNFLIEFYRPRTGMEGRPVFESRILSFFTEPGGILRNVANTLDYQFGFKVSGTWIYSFLEKSILPLIAVWIFLFWLFTSVDEVAPGEMGVRETFGIHSDHALTSGVYLKWPWPIQIIRKIPVNEIQQIFIGPKLKDINGKESRPDIVLWTESHYAKEGRFLIATDLYQNNKDEKSDDVPVSMIAAMLPIQFKVKPDKIFEFAYQHKNPVKILKSISEKVITNYFASADMLKLMSDEREKAIKEILIQIRDAVDRIDLGVDIVAVTFLDAHPPIDSHKLPEAFQEVVAATEEKESEIHKAEAYRARVLPQAEADALRSKLEAEAYRDEKTKISKAEISRFKKRLPGYRAMPEMYLLNSMMNFLEKDCSNVRKYIVPDDTQHDVYIINLEEKQKLDLLDLTNQPDN